MSHSVEAVLICGTATSYTISRTSNPHGYLFMYHVSGDTRDEDMPEWIENLNVNIIDFRRASYNEASRKSFVQLNVIYISGF